MFFIEKVFPSESITESVEHISADELHSGTSIMSESPGITAAERNLNILKENGVIKLTFGYHTIYDKCQRDKVRDE